MFVPVFARPLVAAVFDLGREVVFAFVRVGRFAAVLDLAGIRRLPKACHPSSVQVMLIPCNGRLGRILATS